MTFVGHRSLNNITMSASHLDPKLAPEQHVEMKQVMSDGANTFLTPQEDKRLLRKIDRLYVAQSPCPPRSS